MSNLIESTFISMILLMKNEEIFTNIVIFFTKNIARKYVNDPIVLEMNHHGIHVVLNEKIFLGIFARPEILRIKDNWRDFFFLKMK
jgi:hypothetical protein